MSSPRRSELSLLPERPGRPPPPALAELRAMLARGREAGAWPTSRPPVVETLGGVRILRFQPAGAPRAQVLHLHGGAFRNGCPEMIGPYAEALAERCAVEMVLPAYRLAPEHPFPAGLADALRVLEALGGAAFVAGDSAGGGLALGVALRGGASRGVILHSPWLDLTATNPSYQTNAATDTLFSEASAREAAELYLQGHDPRDPLASPLFADLRGMPPALVSYGEGEVLADDARRLCDALTEAGGEVRPVPVFGMDHVAVTRGLALPGAATVFAETVAFIDARLT